MSSFKYYVTYCIMGPAAGSNPFGHICLLFSEQKKANGPIEVIDAIGHYSQPSSTTNPLIRGMKWLTGFKIDLQNVHGVLKKESMRDLDGEGLHGISFEVEKEKFDEIHNFCLETCEEEKQTINQLNDALKKEGMKKNGYTRLIKEKAQAEIDSRDPKLKPFHVEVNFSLSGFDSSKSYTCKNRALDILFDHGLIDDKTRGLIYSSKAAKTFPRFSNAYTHPLRFINDGGLQTHYSSRTGKIYYYSAWGNNQLFWATPVHTLQEKLTKQNKVLGNVLYNQLNDILKRLRKMQETLKNKISELDNSHEAQSKIILKEQLERIKIASSLFTNAYENSNPVCLKHNLLRAESTLMIAEFSLTPQKANYSFIFRAIQSASMLHMLLGIVAMAAAISLLGITPIGIAAISCAAIYTAKNIHSFYKEEVNFAEKRSNYVNYIEDNPQFHPAIQDEGEYSAEPSLQPALIQ